MVPLRLAGSLALGARTPTSADLVLDGETNGAGVTASGGIGNPGPSWHVIGLGDFNHDGRSDILWQNDSGEAAIWEMNGTNVIATASLGNPGPDWHILGTGDYNSDGRTRAAPSQSGR